MIRLAKSLGRQTTAAGAGGGPRAEGENCPELGLRCQEQPDGQAQRVLVGSRPNAGSTPPPPHPRTGSLWPGHLLGQRARWVRGRGQLASPQTPTFLN